MKKLNYFLMLIASVLSLSSCVDKEFDFSKIDDSDITIGNSYSIPVGNVEIDLPSILESVPGTGESKEYTIPEKMEDEVNIGSGFDKSIIEDLLNTEAMSMDVEVANPLPADVEMKVSLSFTDENGNEVPIIENGLIAGDKVTLKDIHIDDEMLNQIAECGKLNYSFDVIKGAGTVVDLSDISSLDINIILNGEGGVKLF